jgi:hypothetical protein
MEQSFPLSFRRYMAESPGNYQWKGIRSGDGEEAWHDQEEDDQHDADEGCARRWPPHPPAPAFRAGSPPLR